MLFDAMIDAFVVPAEEHQMVIVAIQLFCFILREGRAGRRQEDHAVTRAFFRQHMMRSIKKRLAHHQHPSPTSTDRIIDLSMPALSEISGIRHCHLHEAAFQSTFDHALMEEGFYEFWEQ